MLDPATASGEPLASSDQSVVMTSPRLAITCTVPVLTNEMGLLTDSGIPLAELFLLITTVSYPMIKILL